MFLKERTTLLLVNIFSFFLGCFVIQLTQRYSADIGLFSNTSSSDNVGIAAPGMTPVNTTAVQVHQSINSSATAAQAYGTISVPPVVNRSQPTPTSECDVECAAKQDVDARFDAVWPQIKQRLCPHMRPNRPLGDTLFSLARDELHMIKWDTEDQGEKYGHHHTNIGAAYAFASGGIAFVPPSGGSPMIYARIFKAANDQIGSWANHFDPGSPWQDIREQYYLSDLIDDVRRVTHAHPCIVTAIRDPISHFLSGYNEIEFRYVREPSRMPNPPALLYSRYQNGTTQRFEQFVADFVGGPKREHWEYYNLQLSHVYSMAGVLTILAEVNATLTDYLPSLNNLTETWPAFVAETCPSMAEQIQKTTPMKIGGQHDSSSDPYGFYTAAKTVWKQQGPTARALCALQAMDYACWEKLPDGVPDLCRNVYASTRFVQKLLRKR